jgi:hypothetical protein
MAFTANAHFAQWSQSLTTGLTTATGSCFNAGVNLPVRSKVKSVTWYYQSAAIEDFRRLVQEESARHRRGLSDHRPCHARRRFGGSHERDAQSPGGRAAGEGWTRLLGRGLPRIRRPLLRREDQVHLHLGRLVGASAGWARVSATSKGHLWASGPSRRLPLPGGLLSRRRGARAHLPGTPWSDRRGRRKRFKPLRG